MKSSFKWFVSVSATTIILIVISKWITNKWLLYLVGIVSLYHFLNLKGGEKK